MNSAADNPSVVEESNEANKDKEPKKRWQFLKLIVFLVVPTITFMARHRLPAVQDLISLKFFYWTIISATLAFSLIIFFEKERNIKLAKSFIFLWTLFVLTFVGTHLQTLVSGISTSIDQPAQLFWNLLMMTSCFGILGSCLNNLRLVIKHEKKSSFSSDNLPSYVYRPLIGGIAGIISFLLFILTDAAQFQFSENLAEWIHIKPYAIVSFISIIAGFGAEKFLEGFSEIAKFIIFKFVEAIQVIFGQNQVDANQEKNHIQIATSMINEGIAIEKISKITGLTVSDIEKLKN